MAPFVPPNCQKGDFVFWYPDCDKREEHASPALVLENCGISLTLIVYRNKTKPELREFIRHAADPYLKDADRDIRKDGAWDVSPQTKRIEALEKALQDLAKSRGK